MRLFNKQYTIGELMNIDEGRQDKASRCSVVLDKVFHELKSESIVDKFKALFLGKNVVKTYYVIFKVIVTSDTGSKHVVFMRLDPDFNLTSYTSNRIQIYCDCPDFKYRSAWQLGQHGSLFTTDKIKVALGSSITETPKAKTKTTLLCKHAFAALRWLVANYQSLMQRI